MNEGSAFCEADENDLARASDLLKTLIQIDTCNPPGNEGPAFDVLNWELQSGGITPEMVGRSSDRPNIVARLQAAPENRTAQPLVLSCHLDTVPVTNPDAWKYPPFSGEEAEGCIWGRGAIDMKGFAVMALTAILLLAKRRVPINRDVIFVAVSDEEAGTEEGSRWLVFNRPDLLHDPEYVINEVGGFTLHRKGKRFYPIQVAEKGVAWLRLTAHSKPGHSSMPAPQTSVSLIAEAITKLTRHPLPFHITDPAVQFLRGFTEHESKAAQNVTKMMLTNMTGPQFVKLIPNPDQRAPVEAILRNTATPTRIHAGEAINVLPSRASVDIDGRLIPGQTSENLIKEVRRVIGDRKGKKYSIEVVKESAGVVFPTDTNLYRAMEEAIGEADPDAIAIPSMIPGFTDSSNYAKLGATCYGFYPVKLGEDINFSALFHGDNERIPVDGFHWGIQTLVKMLGKFLTS